MHHIFRHITPNSTQARGVTCPQQGVVKGWRGSWGGRESRIRDMGIKQLTPYAPVLSVTPQPIGARIASLESCT